MDAIPTRAAYLSEPAYRTPLERTLRMLLLCVVVAITFFANNRLIAPDIMESRNLITAREMVEKGNYLIPTMNDKLRLEKPPLPTWVAASIESVSPGDVALQRAAAGLMGVLLVVFFYLFALKVMRIDPLLPTLILCTCYNFVLMGRTASWDIYCHAFMTGSIYFSARALTERGHKLWTFFWAGLLMGLSILSKGPVSLFALYLPFILAMLLCVPMTMRGKWPGLSLMIVMAVGVGCWWYLYIHAVRGDELAAMAAQETGSWMGRNVRPWWYYWSFFLETGIWAVMLITSIIMIGFHYRPWRRREYLVPLVWMLAALVLLSCMPEKKTRYLLPVIIPASMLMGQLVQEWRSAFSKKYVPMVEKVSFRLNCWLLALAVAALPVAGWIFLSSRGLMPVWQLVLFGIFFLLVAVGLGISAVRLRPGNMVWLVAILFCVAEIFALPKVMPLINNPEMKSISATATMPELKGLPFYAPDDEELRIEMVYAARRSIHQIDLSDTASLRRRLPAVVLTHGGTAEKVPAAFLQTVDTVHIGTYDDNRRPKGTRRYSPRFIYNVTVLREKQ